MKVTIIISNISKCGGTERAVSNLVKFLVHTGKQVDIISIFSSTNDNLFFHIPNNVSINHLNISGYENKGVCKKLWGLFKSIRGIKKVLKDIESDILIGTSRNTNVISLLFKPRLTKLIGCEHFAHNAPMNRILRKIRDFSYKSLDRLVVLTERDFKYYVNKGVNAIVIPNAVDTSDGNPNDIINYKKKIALAVGRHSPEKAFDKLIQLWSKIEKKIPDWHLYIIGDGILKSYNQEIANKLNCKRIIFLPFQNDIESFYRQASIYLMTSIYEALPMVLIEAKINGCINIAFDCETGPREIIEHNKDGFLISVNDDNEFIQTTIELMNNPQKICIMSNQSIINGLRYGSKTIMPLWDSLLSEL